MILRRSKWRLPFHETERTGATSGSWRVYLVAGRQQSLHLFKPHDQREGGSAASQRRQTASGAQYLPKAWCRSSERSITRTGSPCFQSGCHSTKTKRAHPGRNVRVCESFYSVGSRSILIGFGAHRGSCGGAGVGAEIVIQPLRDGGVRLCGLLPDHAVRCACDHHQPRTSDHLLEHTRLWDGGQRVFLAVDDQRWHGDRRENRREARTGFQRTRPAHETVDRRRLDQASHLVDQPLAAHARLATQELRHQQGQQRTAARLTGLHLVTLPHALLDDGRRERGGVVEDQTGHPVRCRLVDAQRDGSTQRMSADDRLVDAQLVEQQQNVLRVQVDRGRIVRGDALPETAQVHRDDAELRAESVALLDEEVAVERVAVDQHDGRRTRARRRVRNLRAVDGNGETLGDGRLRAGVCQRANRREQAEHAAGNQRTWPQGRKQGWMDHFGIWNVDGAPVFLCRAPRLALNRRPAATRPYLPERMEAAAPPGPGASFFPGSPRPFAREERFHRTSAGSHPISRLAT